MTRAANDSGVATDPPSSFALLSDDIVINVLAKLESDPRDWARLACASSRFDSLVRAVCCPSRCSRHLPSDLTAAAGNVGGWPVLHKLSVCCPGLRHAGVLLDTSDFGLHLDIGPDPSPASSPPQNPSPNPNPIPNPGSSWNLLDDLYMDAEYDVSESHLPISPPEIHAAAVDPNPELSRKRKKQSAAGPAGAHLASGAWNLSREQGNKLLASRFRGDSLYICRWPGCLHAEEKRNYMLFRGVFRNFRRSGVWRAINDASRSKIGIGCAFCRCEETWDLHSAFCLRRVFGFHDDGEPVVRAYVCENGHVSGAWTERPMYT